MQHGGWREGQEGSGEGGDHTRVLTARIPLKLCHHMESGGCNALQKVFKPNYCSNSIPVLQVNALELQA